MQVTSAPSPYTASNGNDDGSSQSASPSVEMTAVQKPSQQQPYPSPADIISAAGSSEPPSVGKPKPHQCQICGRGFTTGGHLQRHQRIHTGVKAFKCPFPGCDTRTSRQDNLQQHYRTHLSPSIRRGSGSEARAAVARALEEAGIRPTAGSRNRKAKSATASSSSSSTHTTAPPSVYGGGSGHSTPNYGYSTAYEPLTAGGQAYSNYSLHHTSSVSSFATPSSASSSRVPSPAAGHSAGHSAYLNSYPHAAYQYNQPSTNPYYSHPSLQPAFTQRMYTPGAQPVYSPTATSPFEQRSASHPALLPPTGSHPYARQQEGSRQSSIEPQNAAQAYSYHTQRQHSAASLHSDYLRGATATQSPPLSRRPSPPGLLDPSASATASHIALRASQLLPSPINNAGQTQGYSSYMAQHAAQQHAFSDSYASQHSQSQRLYDSGRFAQSPHAQTAGDAPPRAAFEEETSNSGSESSNAALAPPTHTYAQQQVPRYQTSPISVLQEKVPPHLAVHSKEIPAGHDWAERRAW